MYPKFGENESIWGSSQGTERKTTDTLPRAVKFILLAEEGYALNDVQLHRFKFQVTNEREAEDEKSDDDVRRKLIALTWVMLVNPR